MPEVVLTSTRMLWYIGTHISIHQQAPKVTLKTNNPHRFSILVIDTQWVNDRVGVYPWLLLFPRTSEKMGAHGLLRTAGFFPSDPNCPRHLKLDLEPSSEKASLCRFVP